MSILAQLEQNKGLVSSALGKTLAQQVLAGDEGILREAVGLLAHESKNVRAGAAKIVEQAAVAAPNRVVGYLPQLLPALAAPEPQTRWMIIHTVGLCAALDPATALLALPKASEFVHAASGACLWGATIAYLGYLGATSAENARTVFPLLEQALRDIPRQEKNVLVGFLRLADQADDELRGRIEDHAAEYVRSEKPGVRAVARKIQRRMA